MTESRIEHTYDLTPVQQGMLFHALSGNVAGVDILQIEGCLDEPLDTERFIAAWQHVMTRHEGLRTGFRMLHNGQLVQDVFAGVKLPVAVHDWSGAIEADQASQWRALVDQDRKAGFDVFKAPLMRVAVAKLSESRFRVLWSLHHAILDGRVFAVVLDDVFAFYDAFRHDQNLERSATRPLRDYIQWCSELDTSGAEAFWKAALGGFSAPTPISVGRPVGESPAEGFGVQEVRLPSQLTERLQALAQQAGVSLGNVLQAAWGLLISRYSREKDIVFGVTRTLRMCGLDGVSDIIGPLINTLPVRLNAEPGQPLVSWLQAVRSAQREIRAHEHTPLVRVQEWSDIPKGSSLFHSIVVFDTQSLDSMLEQRSARWQGRKFDWSGQTNFGVTLLGWGESNFRLRLEYYRNVLDDSAAERMLRHLCVLLGAMPAHANDAIRYLPIVGPEEREHLLKDWNQNACAYPMDALLHELIEAQVDRTPERTALVAEQGSLTYAELDAKANQLARRLRELGVGPGKLVGIAMERSLELVIGLLGILKAGGAYVPMDPSYPKDRLAFMLEDANVPILLTQSRLRDTLPENKSHTIAIDAPDSGVQSHGTGRLAVPMKSDDVAYVIFTSGSTGRPKGAMNAHRGIVNRLLWMQDEYQLGADDAVLQKTPFSFDVSVWEFFWPLLIGAKLVMAIPEGHKDAAYLVRTVVANGITTMHFVPAMLQAFLEEDTVGTCATLRRVICSGEALSAELRDHFFERLGCELHNLYGPTEAAVDVTYWECRRDDRDRAVPIGRPVANTQIYVLDEQLEPVPLGLAGELHIGGIQVGLGYLGRPELTAQKFIADPFSTDPSARLYKTGDLARYRSDGAIEYLGRIDQQVKLRGFRIELGEIESLLAQQPGINEVVVIVRQDGPGDAELVAYVVPAIERPDQTEFEDLLRAALRVSVPEFMVPSTFVFLSALPLTPSGKVNRRALPAPNRERRRVNSELVAPRDEFERKIIEIWSAVLKKSQFGIDDNFFDVGGNSLLAIQVVAQARRQGLPIEVLMLFRYPTVRALAEHFKRAQDATGQSATSQNKPTTKKADAGRRVSTDVAVIGMAGRFPGAANVEEFWNTIEQGAVTVTHFGADELEPSWIETPGIRELPNYVRARGILKDADKFDAAFFGITPREASVLDPQNRLFLEESWAALEDAGYDPNTYAGSVGVWAGKSNSTYYLENVLTRRDILNQVGPFQAMLVNEKDFLTTRVSYKLNLKGPSVNVYTGCSTSLVAVAEAYRALIDHQCDMAIAGGVTVTCPQHQGYLYQQGAIGSPDGHCRAFDAKAAGTVFGDGVGAVVLKRLQDAVADGDFIYAVIRGAGLNNDGSNKVSFTAPSVDGQASVISAALAAADVNPESIGYVEAHGTATPLGDPIEVAALTQAYRERTSKNQYCCLGSVKSNIGHLDAAAGIAGFMKAVLALHHRVLPATAHFECPNPVLNLPETPFFVNSRSQPWAGGATPRRAGVSAFGIGGTNVHVILEESASRESKPATRPEQLLVLSTKTPTALDDAASRLGNYLRTHPQVNLADLAYSLQVGRHAFAHRRAVVGSSVEQVVTALGSSERRPICGQAPGGDVKVAFLFPGQGSQYAGMASELYQREPVFAAEFDACANALLPLLGFDIRDCTFGTGADQAAAQRKLSETAVTQPVLFAVELALAKLWMSWGIQPSAMIGHSLGEYVAACLAGVFSREDCLAVVAARGRIMQAQPRGSMMAVRASRTVLEPLLGPDLVIAGFNAPQLNVVAGPADSLRALEAKLKEQGIGAKLLETSHAFHSSMMDGALEPFRQELARTQRQRPSRPWISCVTGDWIVPEQAVEIDYWVQQLRQPVRFTDGLQKLLQDSWALLEVGPGHALAALVRQHAQRPKRQVMAVSIDRDAGGDVQSLLGAMGHLWVAGAVSDWTPLHRGERRNRTPLPSYPFERKRFWLEADSMVVGGETSGAVSRERAADSFGSEASAADADSGQVAESATPEQHFLISALRNLLGVQTVSVDDDFFQLGAESLSGIQLLARIRSEYGVEFELKNLLQYPTARKLAEQIVERRPAREIVAEPVVKAAQEWSPLVMLAPGSGQPPLYCVAGIGGTVMELHKVATNLGPGVPFYGLESRGVAAGLAPARDVREMARDNIKAIKAHQPRGPYYLAGYSAGGTVAYEMAQQLQANGDKVALLALLDAGSPTLRRRTQLELRKAQLKRILHDPAPNLQEIWERNRERMKGKLGASAELEPYHEVQNATVYAVTHYQPARYAGDVVLYRTHKDDLVGDIVWTVDEYNGWRELVLGQIEVVPIPGSHLSMVQNPEYARALAIAMRKTYETVSKRAATSRGNGQGITSVHA
jgi:amino acid adenylation domain-containing protein